MVVADNQLHGRACCRNRIIWNCFSSKNISLFCNKLLLLLFHCLSLTCSFQAKCLETGETVAIKKVLQDRRYKNRELQLMRLMDHPNVVSLKHCFFSTTSKDELFLNLVMEYVPETMYRVLKHYSSMNQRMPLIYVKLYTYQVCILIDLYFDCPVSFLSYLNQDIFCSNPDNRWKTTFQIFRGLAYIHTVPGVCHRDVKPQNLLVCFY